MGNTISEIDAFDFEKKEWSTVDAPIPTVRAGLFLAVVGDEILALGGEALGQKAARSQVEALNTTTGQWRSLTPLRQGRHGTGAVLYDGNLYVASGSGNIGGGPELTTQEAIAVSEFGDTAGQ